MLRCFIDDSGIRYTFPNDEQRPGLPTCWSRHSDVFHLRAKEGSAFRGDVQPKMGSVTVRIASPGEWDIGRKVALQEALAPAALADTPEAIALTRISGHTRNGPLHAEKRL